MRGTLILCLSFVVAAVAACSDDTGTDPPATACYDYAAFVETPNVSFETDVLPIMRRSCGLAAACHQTNPGSLKQPYLGNAGTAPMTPAEIQEIFDENVNVTSAKALGMDIIAAGDPANSFLMHKVDGTLACPTIQGCTGTACGGTMPIGGKLAAAELDLIRSWIKQGAANN